MPTTPFASAQFAVNAGAPVQGGQTVPGGATIQLSGTNTSNWTSARWEIFAYPLGWPTPSGWTLDSNTGIIYSTATTPTLITLEAASTRWGKWLVRLIVNGGTKNGVPPVFDPTTGSYLSNDVIDFASGWQVLSPGYGLFDLALYESTQFGGLRRWADALQRTLRLIDTITGGSGGGAFNNQRATGAAPSITVTASSTPQGAWYRSVSSGGTCVLPTSPTAGQVVQIVDEDGTATQFGITVNAGSNTIVAYAAGASTYAFSNANGYAARSVLNLTWNAAAGFWKVT